MKIRFTQEPSTERLKLLRPYSGHEVELTGTFGFRSGILEVVGNVLTVNGGRVISSTIHTVDLPDIPEPEPKPEPKQHKKGVLDGRFGVRCTVKQLDEMKAYCEKHNLRLGPWLIGLAQREMSR
jgi:hypothetical protein